MTKDTVKRLLERIEEHPNSVHALLDREALDTIKNLTKSLDIQIESSSTYARELEAEIEKLRNPWQPIETAPKDGMYILVTAPDYGCKVMFWYQDGWDDGDFESGSSWPAHWMPLPEPPKTEVDNEDD